MKVRIQAEAGVKVGAGTEGRSYGKYEGLIVHFSNTGPSMPHGTHFRRGTLVCARRFDLGARPGSGEADYASAADTGEPRASAFHDSRQRDG